MRYLRVGHRDLDGCFDGGFETAVGAAAFAKGMRHCWFAKERYLLAMNRAPDLGGEP